MRAMEQAKQAETGARLHAVVNGRVQGVSFRYFTWRRAQELGLTTKLLYRWRSELLKGGTDAFPGHGTLPPSEQEVATLRRELERVRQERDILKKALSIFSRQQ